MINVEQQSIGSYLGELEGTHGHDFTERNIQLLSKLYASARRLIYTEEEYAQAFNKCKPSFEVSPNPRMEALSAQNATITRGEM